MFNNDVQVEKQSKNKGLSLSESAIQHLTKQLAKQPKAIGVKLSLNKTGCSGLSYVFDFIEKPEPLDKSFEFNQLQVFVDHQYYPYLKGTHIDFVKEGLNHKYVYQNPNQTGQCGCGESFTIDEAMNSPKLN